MRIRFNGAAVEIAAGLTAREFLTGRNIDCSAVIFELNRAIVPPDAWDRTVLKENDALEVLSFVGGG